ncbi:MAG: Holliday junction branch migration DNA helicase RuvB [Brevinematales bacterium]|nr:Holliday junction branch migration DNA helicase RuvB [Brevinematales bacterium]
MIEEKLTNPIHLSEDMDDSLRPRLLTEFIGQAKVKENVRVFIEAAKIRKAPLDHVLLYGPPGLGKTTLVSIIANELGRAIKITSAPALEKAGDLVAILTSLEEGDVLFIDEIHRMKRVLEEVLYSAMEDFKVDVVIGEGTGARTIRLNLPKFTLAGATTRSGAISSPLRSRFGIIERLDFYDTPALQAIISRSARILNIVVDDGGSEEIARRSRGTPRIANRLLRRVSDFALVENHDGIDGKFAAYALGKLEVDKQGLDSLDRKFLNIIIDHYKGGPVGVSAIAAALNEETETIEDMCEPYLIQIGFVQRTPRGRMASRKAYEHLGVEYREQDPGLFG